MNQHKLSETVIFEEGDLKAEYLFQRVILDRDMVQGFEVQRAGATQ